MLIAFSGLKGSGKDTAAKVLVDEYGFTKIAFADALREALLILNPWVAYAGHGYGTLPLAELIEDSGWDWAKNNVPEVRRLMQVFGTEVGRQLLGENVWVDILFKKYPDINSDESRYVITDCRFDNEARFVDTHSGSIIWIERPELVSDGHASESPEMKRWRRWIITNDETLEKLQKAVRTIMTLGGVEPIERRITE